MEVFELLVDFDGTARSRPESMGLFATQKLASKAWQRINAKGDVFGGHTIRARYVMTAPFTIHDIGNG